MKDIKLGKYNKLIIERETDYGLFLTTENREEEILLPNQYVKSSMNIGDEINVFVYSDSEDRYVATTETPKATLGEFCYLKVIDNTNIGAFMDWGLLKDLFVPKSMQKIPFKVGNSYILRISYDAKTDRLIGDTRIQKYLSKDLQKLKKFNEVKLLVIAKTPLGYKVIINNMYEGMLFNNEIFEKINIGDKKIGFIKNIRDDGKLDISLQPIGKKKDDVMSEKIIKLLKENQSSLPYNYKSDAIEIKKIFNMSKKSFKKALTKLQDSAIITIDDKGIYLSN